MSVLVPSYFDALVAEQEALQQEGRGGDDNDDKGEMEDNVFDYVY